MAILCALAVSVQASRPLKTVQNFRHEYLTRYAYLSSAEIESRMKQVDIWN